MTILSDISPFLFAAGMPFSHVIGYIAAIIGIVVFLPRQRSLFRQPMVISIILFLVYGCVRSLYLPQPAMGGRVILSYFAHWLLPFAMGYAIAGNSVVSRRSAITYIAVYAAIIGLSVLSYAGLFWSDWNGFYLSRDGLLKGLHHHITMGGICLILAMLCFSMCLLHTGLNMQKRILLGSAGIFFVCSLLLTGSRGYYIAFAVVLVLFVFWLMLRFKKYVLGISILSVCLIAGYILSTSIPRLNERIISALSKQDNNVSERLNIYRVAAMEIHDRPLFGFGPGQAALQDAYYARVPELRYRDDQGKVRHRHMHCFYFNLAADLGFTGMLIFMSIVFFAFQGLIDAYRRFEEPFDKALAVGVAWAFVGILFGDLFDTLLRGPSLAMDIFWLIGIVMGLKVHKKVAEPLTPDIAAQSN
jgi:O-antigen ligase